jgi:rod shape-determining protein MreC
LQALQRFDSLVQENIRLREILNASAKLNDNVQIARIISADINPFRHIIVIDKGTQNNLYNGQVIVDTNGVVGQILQTSFLSSHAILISDTDHALPIEVNRNGLRTIAQGNGSYDRLDIPYIPNNADIRVGDLIVTSGLGGKFPAGYPVALIDKVSRNPSQQFAYVSAKPTASLNQIREVMLIDKQ